MNRRGYTRWRVRLRHRTQTRLYLTQGRDMAASRAASTSQNRASTLQNRATTPPQQWVPFGRQQVQRRKATRNKGPVFSEVASSSTVQRYPQGGAAISSVGDSALVEPPSFICVETTDCVTSTASIGSGGGGYWAVHAERRRRPSAHKRKLREFRIRTACAKGAENEDV